MVFFFFCIAVLLTTACKEINNPTNVQRIRQIDPDRLKKIKYPPLTDREGKGLTLPVPPAEHPRLFFRKSDIETIKKNANHSLLEASWGEVRQSSLFPTDGKLKQDIVDNYDFQIIDAIEARALMYALNGDKKMGKEAVELIFNMHNTFIIDSDNDIYSWTNSIGRMILGTSVVYDWCYDLIAPDEKKSLIAIMESLATEMELKWPQLVLGSVTSHGVEFNLARDILSFGIAVYDEKPEIYERAAGRIFAEFIPAQNYGYESGHHHQGSFYGPHRFRWEMYTMMLFSRMGYTDLNRPLQGKMPYYWMYTRRPDGILMGDGDSEINAVSENAWAKWWKFPDLFYTASFYQDPLLMGEANRLSSISQTPLYDVLLIDPTVQTYNNLASLPLTKYFPSPFGGMAVRTDWNDGITSNAVVAEMRIKERHFANHQHLDAGSFQIYYKGPLAVESGIYQGSKGSYGCSHFMNYFQRTIAHNGMLVHNPAERFNYYDNTVANDGGQRFPLNGREPRNMTALMAETYKTGEVLAHDFGIDQMTPEYSYLKGDITAAYTDKVKNHQRAFVFLNLTSSSGAGVRVPAALIVHDYIVSSDKDFKKTWLLHCVQKPTFKGNETIIERNQKGYNGKLVNTTLLPEQSNTNLVAVGGTGNEFTVGGVNYPQSPNFSPNSWDGAIWRVELSPKSPSETDVFLNVMQVTDAGNTNLLPVEKIETDRLTGVQIGDRIVLFSKNGNLVNSTVNLEINGSGTFKVLITDLEKGDWEIAGAQSPNMVRNDNNLVYFQATAGNYVIMKE